MVEEKKIYINQSNKFENENSQLLEEIENGHKTEMKLLQSNNYNVTLLAFDFA